MKLVSISIYDVRWAGLWEVQHPLNQRLQQEQFLIRYWVQFALLESSTFVSESLVYLNQKTESWNGFGKEEDVNWNNCEPFFDIPEQDYGHYECIPWIQKLLFSDGQCAHTSHEGHRSYYYWTRLSLYLFATLLAWIGPIEQFWSKVKYLIKREKLKDKETLSSRISEACQKVEHNDLHGYVEHSADRIADCLNKCAMYFFILSYIYPLTSIISLCISINFSSMVTDELTIGRDIEKKDMQSGKLGR